MPEVRGPSRIDCKKSERIVYRCLHENTHISFQREGPLNVDPSLPGFGFRKSRQPRFDAASDCCRSGPSLKCFQPCLVFEYTSCHPDTTCMGMFKTYGEIDTPPMTILQLAESTASCVQPMNRVMRLLVANGIFSEPRARCYSRRRVWTHAQPAWSRSRSGGFRTC